VRGAFLRTLVELANGDPRILLLTGDLGYTVIEPFAERFPGRFFNVGVAEQNMVGLATGLAEAGFIPFVYSIATFATLRPYEFIRNGPILHQLPVRIVGVGGGFEYGPAGATHFAVEDLGVMRIQPGITIVCPADHQQAGTALRSTWDLEGPVYYRLGKDERTTIPGLAGRFTLGRAERLYEGDDLLILAIGAIAADAVAAAETLTEEGIHCTVAVVASLNPSPLQDLADLLSRFRRAMTVEAHYTVGGLGSLVAEIIAERGIPCQLRRCGVTSTVSGMSGSDQHLAEAFGLTSAGLARTARGICHGEA
jgi:transketolase